MRHEAARARIQTTQILKRLISHAMGEIELSSTQVRAAEILLRKTIPDLSAVEYTGEVVHSYVARTPEPTADAEEWASAHAVH